MLLPILLAAVGTPQSAPGAILIDRDRADRARPVTARAEAAPAAPVTRVTAGGVGTPISGIRFIGAKAPAPVANAAQRFLGRPANTATLQELAAALSGAYEHSHIALYTVAIPDQDFASGVVMVHLTEGRIARAAVKADPDRHRLLRARMAPLLDETPLGRGTFERQVTLMRAIPGMTFDSDFQDPDSTGALALTVTPHQKRHTFSLGFSNRGVDLLGDGQFDAKGEFYGLGTDGDQLTLSASAARDLKRFRYGSVAYTAPLTASGLSITGSGAYLETRPEGSPIKGSAKLAGVTIAYPLVRDFHHAADVSLGVDGLDSDNAVFGSVIATERTRAIRAAGSWSVAREQRAISLSGSLSKGIDALGARVTRPIAEAGFLKGTASATVAQQIGKRLTARMSASGQYTRDRLPAAEAFSIGGETIGRAFDTALLSGDRGVGGLAEIAYRPVKAGRLAQSELYGFVDGGTIGVLDRGAGRRLDYSLASAGIGLRARYRDKAEIGVEGARTIDDPYPGYTEDWRFSVAWRLSM